MRSILFPIETTTLDLVHDLNEGADLALAQGSRMDPRTIFETLNAAKLKAVLVGAHAINARSGKPRATRDVDLVAEKPKKVAEVLQLRFKDLSLEDHPVVLRFKLDGKEAIDIIKPESAPIFKHILKHVERITIDGVEITIPSLEATLALKFASMTSLTRQMEDRYTDGRDFILVARLGATFNEALVVELGDLAFPDGGSELLQQIADARAGKPLKL